MHEIELKFQVPAARRAALLRALATPSATRTTLHALYVDTPDRRLADARMALRLRREGRRWLQTLKAETAELHRRLEHELPVPAPRRGQPPVVDIARHAGTPAGEQLQQALGGTADTLAVVQEMRFQRTLRVLRSGRSRVAVTLDVGEIHAGERRLPLHELEFELLDGRAEDLVALARRWASRFGLWLDVRSKAERGERLARGVAGGPAVKATPSTIEAGLPAEAALRRMVMEALGQALPNAADWAGAVGSAEQLHQLRVALRRLRSVLRLYGHLSPAVDPAWEPALKALFNALGQTRERDALEAEVLPLLTAAGAPHVALPPPTGDADPAARLREAGTTELWLALLGFAIGQPLPPATAGTDADADTLLAPLRALQRRLARAARRFDRLDEAERHRVRKQLKRLRYGLEFTAAWWPQRPLQRGLARLRQAQEALGRCNDLTVAEALYREVAEDDGRAWFAVGWLVAQQGTAVQQARRALLRWAKAAPATATKQGRRRRTS